MKNNRNKIIAALCCGVVIGSVGTGLSGVFQGGVGALGLEEQQGSRPNDDANFKNKQGFLDFDDDDDHDDRDEKRKGRHESEASLDSTQSVDVASGSYKDGTYEGTSSGYSSGLKVSVSIEGGKIASVDVVSHNETPGFYEKAFEKVPAEIVQKQNTNVDTASGATYSSVGIINAVNSALSSAKA